MSYNWSIVQKKLYGILKGSGDDISMFDAKGNKTIDPEEASRFFVKFNSNNKKIGSFMILVAIHDQGQSSFINIKTPEIADDEDFKIVHTIRDHIRNSVGRKEGVKVNWQVFDHEIDPREEAVNNIKESKDISKVFGSTKSSFQRIGEAKLIIRHTGSVNEEKHGARTRQIRAIFVENRLGERFSYPHLHMTGARAFARHISNGGTNHDSIASAIFEMSKDYLSIRNTGHQLRKNNGLAEWVGSLRENMYRINKTLKSLHGPKGYNSTSANLTLENILTDSQSIRDIHNKLAETCGCQPEDPMHQDLGRAAHYISAYPMAQKPMTFSWSGQPDITPPDEYGNVLERLNWQLSQLSGACNVKESAARLAEIATKIKSGIKIEEDELDFIREAFSSNLSYVPEDNRLPEEKELDEFIDSFDLPTTLEEDPFEPNDKEAEEQPVEEDVDNPTLTDFNPAKDDFAYQSGYDAIIRGKHEDDCPYEDGSDLAAKWHAGYKDGLMHDYKDDIDMTEATTTNHLADYKYKNIQGLYNYKHFEHPDGSFIQIRRNSTKDNFDGIHKNGKTGEMTKFKDIDSMKTHVNQSHSVAETEIDETDAIIKRMSNLAGI